MLMIAEQKQWKNTRGQFCHFIEKTDKSDCMMLLLKKIKKIVKKIVHQKVKHIIGCYCWLCLVLQLLISDLLGLGCTQTLLYYESVVLSDKLATFFFLASTLRRETFFSLINSVSLVLSSRYRPSHFMECVYIFCKI